MLEHVAKAAEMQLVELDLVWWLMRLGRLLR